MSSASWWKSMFRQEYLHPKLIGVITAWRLVIILFMGIIEIQNCCLVIDEKVKLQPDLRYHRLQNKKRAKYENIKTPSYIDDYHFSRNRLIFLNYSWIYLKHQKLIYYMLCKWTSNPVIVLIYSSSISRIP